MVFYFFVFKRRTSYELLISDWSSDVCSSDLDILLGLCQRDRLIIDRAAVGGLCRYCEWGAGVSSLDSDRRPDGRRCVYRPGVDPARQYGGYAIIVRHSGSDGVPGRDKSEEHTSELQTIMSISYAVFCCNTKMKI